MCVSCSLQLTCKQKVIGIVWCLGLEAPSAAAAPLSLGPPPLTGAAAVVDATGTRAAGAQSGHDPPCPTGEGM